MKGRRTAWDGQRETLDDLAEAVHYNRWIHRMIRPYLGDRILEIGCGTGNLTGFLLDQGPVLAVDANSGYLRSTRSRHRDRNLSTRKVDLEKGIPGLRSFRPDTLVCVNVLEHLQEDRKILRQCLHLLPSGGRLLLFVPALRSLFGSMDLSYGHFRRYDRLDLLEKIRAAGFQIEYCRYLNLLGILGWWWNGKVLRKALIPKGQLLLYDRIVRFTGRIERFLPKPVGLSLFCAARKP